MLKIRVSHCGDQRSKAHYYHGFIENSIFSLTNTMSANEQTINNVLE